MSQGLVDRFADALRAAMDYLGPRRSTLDFMPLAELARETGVSETTLREWVASGHLPVWQPGGKGGTVLVSVRRLNELVYEQSQCRSHAPGTVVPMKPKGQGRRSGGYPARSWEKP